MKIITAQEAAGLIADGSTVAIGGFGAYGCPDQLLDAVVQRHRTLPASAPETTPMTMWASTACAMTV